MKKVTKEIERKFDDIPQVTSNEDGEIVEILTDTVEVYEGVDNKKAGGWVSALAPLATGVIYWASSQGYIPVEIAQLIDSLLSNPEVLEAADKAVEGAGNE